MIVWKPSYAREEASVGEVYPPHGPSSVAKAGRVRDAGKCGEKGAGWEREGVDRLCGKRRPRIWDPWGLEKNDEDHLQRFLSRLYPEESKYSSLPGSRLRIFIEMQIHCSYTSSTVTIGGRPPLCPTSRGIICNQNGA